MNFYVLLNENNVILDVIEYPVEGYSEVYLPYKQLPAGINGGWWKLENGVLIEIVELNPNTIDNQIKTAIDAYTLELVEGGLL